MRASHQVNEATTSAHSSWAFELYRRPGTSSLTGASVRREVFRVEPEISGESNQLVCPGMNVALWILQILLGVFFVWHSSVLLRPSPALRDGRMRWVLEMNSGLRVFAGVSEGLAGL